MTYSNNTPPNGNGYVGWLRSRAKMITIYAGAVAAVISVAVGWNQLKLDRPAMFSEVASVQEFAEGTRKIVLGDKWFRLKAELRAKQAELTASPRDRELIEEVTRLEQQLRDVEEQLKQLAE